ncbi:son of sevenless homolog 2-like [Physella acuta]|uniref:son of sevenless homolog 2-like n=1 Tax=Physella acuta TaxID=109671 RepID=UPI0027DE4399|nr:son of sevenless homolog 2-like [Physella acuta]
MYASPYSSGDSQSHTLTFLDNNASKWKGIFTTALKGVQKQVHPCLATKEDALDYIENLMIRLLGTLCSAQPHSPEDVDERISRTFPDPIDKWAMRDAQNALKDGKKNSTIVLPVDKILPLLRDELGYRVDYNLALYITAVLEYIAADILKISGIYVKNIRHTEISLQDIKVAICADQVLYDMFFQEEEISVMVEDEPVRREKMSYEEIVKDLIMEETQYLRDLNMIIRVFRAPFAKFFPRSKDLEVIFSNILDIYDFTAKLLSSVEDQVEMAQGEAPLVGTCFTDLTEGEEFSVYERYVTDMIAPNGKGRLNALLMRDDVIAYLKEAGNGFREAFKYVLPKLLMGPMFHCLQYFEIVKALICVSPSDEDRECLTQADGLLQALKARLERQLSNIPKRKNWELSLRMHSHSRSATVQKMTEIQKSIDNWDSKDIIQMCSEFIMEGPLTKVTGRRTPPERYCFLFDGLIILCKSNPRRTSGTGPVSEYKLKEKFLIRKIEVVDKEDTEDLRNAFEIHPREHSHIVLQAKTSEDKFNWMAALVSLQTRSMLERSLDSMLREEEKNNPLILPSSSQYEFAMEDSSKNIIFEENQDSSHESPLIKGGQLVKLVERLTYHMYADPRFLRTFLLTYRSFCSSRELLDLLVKRFDIPEPNFGSPTMDDNASLKMREDIKRFRNEYVKPVQFRVANVFRHWVDNHFYDFERDPELLVRLNKFLQNIKGKAMRKMADIISKSIQRKLDSSNTEREFTYQEKKPKIEWHITKKPEEFNLMTLHPIEIARQVTLLEFDLYRAIKPSELVGMPWMKKDKQQTAPNLLKMIHFSTNFTYWLELFIVETHNLDERVAVMSRVIEVMMVFQELNNFNGVLEVIGALNSASVFRLEHTKRELPSKYQKALEEASELNNDHFRKYIEKLRSINPPCVPFLGMYLTNILKTEEGNPDFVANAPEGIINFSKRRKVAEITGEIQQYQNQPYCLDQENSIREFFAMLDPLKERKMSEKELEDYLYKTSLDIEPRDGKLARFGKRFQEYSLKSPGIKPSTNRHGSSTKSNTLPSLPKMSEEDDSSHSACNTPTSPHKPQSPTATVFANSPEANSNSTSNREIHGPHTPSFNPTDAPELRRTPPPLPPRRGNPFVPEPPPPPPRIDSDRPPPVPPRRDSMPQHVARSQSVSNTTNGTPPIFSYNSFTCQDSEPSDDRPVLPPRTYLERLSHYRKQSS